MAWFDSILASGGGDNTCLSDASFKAFGPASTASPPSEPTGPTEPPPVP
jgi:hypothetical protein